ncbi:hypothetical protein M0R04_02650 [Candidatus Dojkabacteria bacterium]|jgi:hypothetical protein|nr:hypothetical protein [Candidatus Dojkabacteria bacterium]
MIYAFAFTKRNISCQTLYNIKNLGSRCLLWGKVSIEKYIKKLLADQPEYILGLGQYTGRDNDCIWMETECSSRFGNNKNDIEHLRIEPFLKETEPIKKSNHIKYSYCNLVSYNICKLIKEKKLKSKYTFLHIPKGMNVELASNEINEALKQVI